MIARFHAGAVCVTLCLMFVAATFVAGQRRAVSARSAEIFCSPSYPQIYNSSRCTSEREAEKAALVTYLQEKADQESRQAQSEPRPVIQGNPALAELQQEAIRESRAV